MSRVLFISFVFTTIMSLAVSCKPTRTGGYADDPEIEQRDSTKDDEGQICRSDSGGSDITHKPRILRTYRLTH